jgi:uroporphyrinogen-III decarboxylase
MTSRQRVLKALNFEQPDRVPLDLGGTIMSGIMAQALHELRRELGLEERPPKVYEVFQMLGEVEADVVEALGIDVLPVEPLVQNFELKRERYKPWRLFDGTPVLVPGAFEVETAANGDLLLHKGGRAEAPVEGRMPKDGYYFDVLSRTQMDPRFTPPPIDELRRSTDPIPDGDLEFLAARAARLRRETDKALLLGCWGRFGLSWVGSIPDFLVLMGTDPDYVRRLFEFRTEMALANLERLWKALGDDVDIVGLDGADFGAQRCEQFNPAWFEQLFVPFYTIQNRWVHENTTWKTWQHSCGSIANILPMLVETGLDILNPVQCSAEGMDAAWLKRTFGGRITFWGGGVDTQRTLPFGTPQEVEAEVAERIRIFAPGGGYVFNPVHNVQANTPARNIVTAYETARRS